MSQFLSGCTSHFFADDVVVLLAGHLGMRYSKQCLDLEKRVKVFLDNLEFYSRLADQPLNHSKTEALYSARAIRLPSFDIKFDCSGRETINWKKDFKYLGYIVSCKLGWGKLIKDVQCKVRRQIALIKSFRLFGCSSPSLRKTLFYSHVLPFFTWIYPVFPLFTRKQRADLSNFYYASLRRTFYCLEWNGSFFSYVFDELSLERRCALYWNRYLHVLADSTDGILLFEKANLAEFRKSWLNKEFSIKGMNRSKRFVPHLSILEKVLTWLSSVPSYSSVPHFDRDDVVLLQIFPETFCCVGCKCSLTLFCRSLLSYRFFCFLFLFFFFLLSLFCFLY